MDPDDILAAHAQGWADTVLRVLRTPWPYGAAHTATGPEDCDVTPTRLHPAFHGCLDWHSSCHMQWSAVRLLVAELPVGSELSPVARAGLVAELDSRLTREHVAIEAAYLHQHPSWERPYGWGWLAMLAGQVRSVAERPNASVPEDLHTRAEAWDEALNPLVGVVADLLTAWLPNLAYPVRHGVHANTAFALGLARDGFSQLGRGDVVEAIDSAATGWFLGDVDFPSAWEPSGSDFLSPALSQADLVRRLLPEAEFEVWLRAFLPALAEPGDRLLEVPLVLDPTDGHAVHLYGLALSRAAMLRRVASVLDPVRAARALAAAREQTAVALVPLEHGDFMSTHWLVSFALLGVDAPSL